MVSNLHIPYDIIITNILSRLPVKSFVRFKCVCKTWKHHIESLGTHTSIIFVAHENRKSLYQLIDLHSSCPTPIEHPLPQCFKGDTFISIEGSCNDLFLLGAGNKYVVWSPSNPTAFRELNFGEEVCQIYGFGYVRYNNDYKIILNYAHTDAQLFGYGRVYGLKTLDSWEEVYFPEFSKILSSICCRAYFNSCMHWLSNTNTIHKFDLHNMMWDNFEHPKECHKFDLHNMKWSRAYELIVYSDSLGLVSIDTENKCHVWVMKEYGVSESWTKLFSLPPNSYSSPFVCEYQVLLSGNEANSRALLLEFLSNKLVWYNHQPEEKEEIVEIQGVLKISEAYVSVFSFLPRRQENSVILNNQAVKFSKEKRKKSGECDHEMQNKRRDNC